MITKKTFLKIFILFFMLGLFTPMIVMAECGWTREKCLGVDPKDVPVECRDFCRSVIESSTELPTLSAGRYGLDNLAAKVGLGGCKMENGQPKCPETDLRQILLRLLQLTLGFTSLIALIIVIYGGFTWATAGGSPDRVKKGRDILVWAAVGLVVLVSAWSIISYVMYLSSQVV